MVRGYSARNAMTMFKVSVSTCVVLGQGTERRFKARGRLTKLDAEAAEKETAPKGF
jgi:transposase